MQTVNKLYFLSVFSLFWFAQLNFLPKGLTSWCSLFFLFFLFYLFLIHQFFVGHFRHIRLARSDLQHFVNVRPQILRCLISEGREAQPTYISIVIFQCNLANFVCVLHIPGAQNDQMTEYTWPHWGQELLWNYVWAIIVTLFPVCFLSSMFSFTQWFVM